MKCLVFAITNCLHMLLLGQHEHPCLVSGFGGGTCLRNSSFLLAVFSFSIIFMLARIDTATAVCEHVPITWYGHRRAVPCIDFPASVAIAAR